MHRQIKNLRNREHSSSVSLFYLHDIHPERIAQTPLLLIRLVRLFSTKDEYCFPMDSKTWDILCANAHLCSGVSGKDFGTEFMRVVENHPKRVLSFLDLLDRSGILERVLPIVTDMKATPQKTKYHPEGDVFIHSLLTLAEMIRMDETRPHMILAAFLHDMGKPAAYDSRSMSFLKHEKIGAVLAEDLLREWGISLEMRSVVSEIIRHHMKLQQGISKKSVGKLLRNTGNLFHDIVKLFHADRCAGSGDLTNGVLVQRYYEQIMLSPANDKSGKQFLVNGDDVMEHFGISEGIVVGKLLDRVQEIVDEEWERRWTKHEMLEELEKKTNIGVVARER